MRSDVKRAYQKGQRILQVDSWPAAVALGLIGRGWIDLTALLLQVQCQPFRGRQSNGGQQRRRQNLWFALDFNFLEILNDGRMDRQVMD